MLHFSSIRVLLTSTRDSVGYVLYIVLVTVLLILSYASVGMALYSGSFYNEFTVACANEKVGRCSWLENGFTKRPLWNTNASTTFEYSYLDYVNFDTFQASLVTMLHLFFLNNWHITHEIAEYGRLK